MAVIGDILVKLQADFAEFSRDMKASSATLESFGAAAQALNQKITGTLGELALLARGAGVLWAVDKVQAYADKVQKMSVEVANLAQQYGLATDEVQAMQLMAQRLGVPMEKLVTYAKGHQEWLAKATADAQQLGLVLDGDVVRTMKTLNDEAEDAQRRFDILFAKGVAAGKSWIAEQLERIVGDLQAVAAHEGILDKIMALGRMLSYSGSTGSAQDFRLAERVAAVASAEAAIAANDRLRAQAAQQSAAMGYPGGPQDNGERAALIKTAEDARIALAQYRDQQAKANYGTTTTLPVIPVVASASRGGGGGRSDAETVDALMKRYSEMQATAQAAQQVIRTNLSMDADDLGLMVEAKQAAADAITRLESRGVAISTESKKALEDQIFLAKQAQAEQNRSLATAKEAEATERKMGDGTAALARVQRDLGREFDSGRLSATAYNRALQQQTEATEQAALEARRYDNDLGSLAAGFEASAKQYQQANDLYSQGGQLFNSFTGLMSDGLDILSGKSTKTFAGIAEDFALMLAKMALQAAASSVFKGIFGSFGAAGTAGSPLYGPVNPAGGGGDVWAGLLGIFGGGRASGGAVQPGYYYTVGEAGPERFVPQAAGRIEPAGGGNMNVVVNNYSDAQVSARKSKTAGGQTELAILVEAVEGNLAGRMSRGQSTLGHTMEGTYGLQRVGR